MTNTTSMENAGEMTVTDMAVEYLNTRKSTVKNGVIVPLNEVKSLNVISAEDLYDMEIPPIEWRIDEILPVGAVAMLSAKPKFFKSYLALGMCIAICQGESYLGYASKKCECLYFDLESSKRRPKARINQITQGKRPPKGLYLITLEQNVAKLHDGFEAQLIDQLEQFPDIGVVVIDVFNKIRKAKRAIDDGYSKDYADIEPLVKIASEYNITILLISHHTKGQHEDAFDDTVGSSGIMGALDVAWSIKKDKRSDEEAVLHITGRDIESQELSMRFDKKSFRWIRIGTKAEVEFQRLINEYHDSNVVRAIKQAVREREGSYSASASELKRYGELHKLPIIEDPTQIGVLIGKYEDLLHADGISVIYDRKASKRKYLFAWNDMS